jgi:DNA-binding response OmpR family regulator
MTSAGGTILVVDDEIGIRRILKVCLTSAGFVVHESASGHEALRAIGEIQPNLVLLDLGLPDMDGSKVVTRVRESNQCPIRRGTFRSVRELIKTINEYIRLYNKNPRSFQWIARASPVIRKVNKYKQTSENGD